jgi:hypothetical protein
MNKEELVEFLKENLQIIIDVDSGERVIVALYLCGEKISSDYQDIY